MHPVEEDTEFLQLFPLRHKPSVQYFPAQFLSDTKVTICKRIILIIGLDRCMSAEYNHQRSRFQVSDTGSYDFLRKILYSLANPPALSVNIFLSDIQYNNRYSALLLLLFEHLACRIGLSVLVNMFFNQFPITDESPFPSFSNASGQSARSL